VEPPSRQHRQLERVDSAPPEPEESPADFFQDHPVSDIHGMVNPVSREQPHVSHVVPAVEWPASDLARQSGRARGAWC